MVNKLKVGWKKRSQRISFIIFLISIGVVVLFQFTYIGGEKKRVTDLCEVFAARIEYQMNHYLLHTYELGTYAKHEGDRITNYQEISRTIMESMPIKCVVLAPDGVISQIYPEDNQQLIGYDLLKGNENLNESIFAALEPYRTLWGEGVFTSSRPIYKMDEGGKEYLWGYVNLVVEFPEALESARLDLLERQGLRFELWKKHSVGDAFYAEEGRQTIVSNVEDGKKINKPIETSFSIANEEWVLGIESTNKRNEIQNLLRYSLIVILINILIWMIFSNYMKMERQNVKLENLALTDPLTGLLNRRAVEIYVEEAIREAKKISKGFSVYFIDLDKFKQINDTFGHNSGDELLIEASKRFRKILKPQDKVARLGGDEFIFVLEDREETTQNFKEELIRVLEEEVILAGTPVRISASVGVAKYPEDGTTFDVLLRVSDNDMFREKCKKKEKFNLENLQTILNHMGSTAIYVVGREKNEILYYNGRVKDMVPTIELGMACHGIWGEVCRGCPLLHLKDKESHTEMRVVGTDKNIIDITASKIMWNDIPAYSICMVPHVKTKEEQEVEFERYYLSVAIAQIYQMVISVNLTKNEFKMIEYDKYGTKKAPYSGTFDELIDIGVSTMHPDFQQAFYDTFNRDSLIKSFESGKNEMYMEHLQMGDDGVYHWTNTHVLCLRNFQNDDILEITLSRNIDEEKKLKGV